MADKKKRWVKSAVEGKKAFTPKAEAAEKANAPGVASTLIGMSHAKKRRAALYTHKRS